MSKLIGSWSFYKKTILIAVPIMVQNLITNLVAMIDNIMVGQIGTEQMSAVAIVNQLFFVFNLSIFGSLSGAGIFSAQFFGKEDIEGVRHTMRFKFMTATVITAIGILVFLLAGDSLVELYLHDTTEDIDLEKTFMYAKDYMLIMLVGLVPFAYEQVYSSTLREGGITTPSMVAGIIAVLTNVGLNALLIFGIGVFPKLGVAGAAIATVISRFVQVAIVIVYSHINSWRLRFIQGLYKSLAVPKKLVKVIMIKGLLPLTANECLWAAGTAALAQCYSVRGLEVVAAQNIASTVVNLFNVMFIAFGSGVSVVIGQMLGANDMKGAKESAPKLVVFAALMCVFIGGLMACFAGVFPHAYNTTDDVKYENLSAGQKQRLDLSIFLAFREIAQLRSKSSANILLLDEILDTNLDDDGVCKIIDILGKQDKINILAISHNSTCKELFENVITIRKKKYGFSEIC